MIKYLKELKKTYLILVTLFVFVFILSGLMAYYTPYSARAFVEYNMHPVYSKLQGVVEEVYVKDGQVVEEGDSIFRLDNEKEKLELKDLKAQYRNEENHLSALDYKILEAKREVLKANQNLFNDKVNYKRYQALYIDDFVAKAEFDRYKLTYKNSIEEVEMAKLSVVSLEKDRGSKEENEVLASIKASIEKKEKDIRDTEVKAPYSGRLFIHQLHRGQAITSNNSYGYVTGKDEDVYVYVDYMEKSLRTLKNDQKVLITFDAIPGKIFEGHIERTTSPLKSGYSKPESLVEIKDETRWIRTVGRTRVKVVLNEKLPEETNIDSGSKAAVTAINSNHKVLSNFTHLWIKTISLLNFVY